MCGIAGFFNLNGYDSRTDAERLVMDQIASLHHRGPDNQGAFVGPGVCLGHARLSILDVSPAANQPMFDASGKICVVFNGEIYNFQEIREQLESRGRRFRTRSDTEVILEGYSEWGIDVVDRLRGMFALAIYDANADRLVLMRDRVGKKPLYYTTHDGVLVFASEIKGILRYPGIERRPNYQAIHEYLTYQYIPSPLTGFAGIHKLPAAHLLVAERGKQPAAQRYFALPKPSSVRHRPIETLREQLVEHLKEATRLRTVADVPIGAFLSGGVDSSSVVAMMALCSESPIKTFTIGFEEQAYDEREFARTVAKRYKTDHHELTVRPDGMGIIDHIVYHYGEPYADSSAIPTYYLSQMARKHVTVVLNGDGGDESFLGYERYMYCRGIDKIGRLPRPMTKRLRSLVLALPPGLDRFKLVRRARRAADLFCERSSRKYEAPIAYFSDSAKTELYAGDMRSFLAESALDRLDDYFDQAQTMTLGAAWADIHTYLPDDLLVKVDVASMAHSLEARSPLLDHKLMEWAATIPEEQRFQGTETKSLFKQAMEPYLPRELLYRPKMGFGAPIAVWLRTNMREFAYDVLLDQTTRERGLFDTGYVRRILDAHSNGQNWASRIWALLMLELWFRMWIDSKGEVPVPTRREVGSYAAADAHQGA
jgi:asparagine synthase (glutamine-hydrolysing)